MSDARAIAVGVVSASASGVNEARARARVLVVGVGGLGCPAAIALARAGVGTIGIADDDVVDLTNLHRQILYTEADVGSPKVEAAARALEAIAPSIRIERHTTRLLPANAVTLVSSYDLVVEGSDNFATKFLTADACALARVAVVHAAAVRWHGTVLAVGARGAPCYRCLFEDLPRENAPNCAEAGVIGPLVGVIGGIQAGLALAMIDGQEIAGTLVTFDGKTDALRRRVIAKQQDCVLCGASTGEGGIDDGERTVRVSHTEHTEHTERIERIDAARYVMTDFCADLP